MKYLLALTLSFYITSSTITCPDDHPIGVDPTSPLNCELAPDLQNDKIIINGKASIPVVITTETTGNATVTCTNNNCKDILNIFAGPLGNFLLECNAQDSCKNAKIRIGNIDEAPTGFNIQEFESHDRNGNAMVDIDCAGKSACAGATVYVKGSYPGGVEILALKPDSFVKGIVVCDLQPGQTCKLICGATTSCANSELICMGGSCQCVGNSCPLIVFPPGSDPQSDVAIGESPNIPGLQCIAGTDDNPPDECRFDKVKLANAQGAVICSENYDCCLCERIKCEQCTAVVCNGDQACIGVPITLYGDEKLGARLACGGDLSCEFSKVYAENLVSIGANGDLSLLGSELVLNMNTADDSKLPALSMPCDGDGSCMMATITAKNVLNLLCGGDFSCERTIVKLFCKKLGTDKGCILSCGGDNSCSDSSWEADGVVAFVANGDHSAARNLFTFTLVEAGAPITCGGDNACEGGQFNCTNVNRLECGGDESCELSKFNMQCVNGKGCPVGINGDEGAKKAVWKVVNAASLACTGGGACELANFDINCVTSPSGCPVSCGGVGACKKLNLDITNAGPFTCSGIDGCRDANLNVACASSGDDKGCPISCVSTESCYGVKLRASNVGGLSCLGNFGCKMARINIECVPGQKGCPVLCGGVRSCPDAIISATNVGEITLQGREVATNLDLTASCAEEKGCRVSCQGVKPCANSTLTITKAYSLTCVGSHACEYSTMNLDCIKKNDKGCSVVCGSDAACSNSVMNIKNSGGLSCVRDSCCDSQFNFVNNKGGILSCVGSSACEGSIIKRLDNVDNVGCSGRNACKNTKLYGSCGDGGCPLICTGFECCRNADIQIENVKEMKCDNTNACSDANILMYTNQGGFKGSCGQESCINSQIKIKSKDKLEYVTGWSCESSFACANSEIIFDGTELFTKQLFVRELSCGAPYACMNTKFVFINAKININTLLTACAGIHACDNNEIKIICKNDRGDILEDVACITEELL